MGNSISSRSGSQEQVASQEQSLPKCLSKLKLSSQETIQFMKWCSKLNSQGSCQSKNANSLMFYCYDCSSNQQYTQCEQCFDAEMHKSHRFYSFKAASANQMPSQSGSINDKLSQIHACSCGSYKNGECNYYCSKHAKRTQSNAFIDSQIEGILTTTDAAEKAIKTKIIKFFEKDLAPYFTNKTPDLKNLSKSMKRLREFCGIGFLPSVMISSMLITPVVQQQSSSNTNDSMRNSQLVMLARSIRKVIDKFESSSTSQQQKVTVIVEDLHIVMKSMNLMRVFELEKARAMLVLFDQFYDRLGQLYTQESKELLLTDNSFIQARKKEIIAIMDAFSLGDEAPESIMRKNTQQTQHFNMSEPTQLENQANAIRWILVHGLNRFTHSKKQKENQSKKHENNCQSDNNMNVPPLNLEQLWEGISTLLEALCFSRSHCYYGSVPMKLHLKLDVNALQFFGDFIRLLQQEFDAETQQNNQNQQQGIEQKRQQLEEKVWKFLIQQCLKRSSNEHHAHTILATKISQLEVWPIFALPYRFMIFFIMYLFRSENFSIPQLKARIVSLNIAIQISDKAIDKILSSFTKEAASAFLFFKNRQQEPDAVTEFFAMFLHNDSTYARVCFDLSLVYRSPNNCFQDIDIVGMQFAVMLCKNKSEVLIAMGDGMALPYQMDWRARGNWVSELNHDEKQCMRMREVILYELLGIVVSNEVSFANIAECVLVNETLEVSALGFQTAVINSFNALSVQSIESLEYSNELQVISKIMNLESFAVCVLKEICEFDEKNLVYKLRGAYKGLHEVSMLYKHAEKCGQFYEIIRERGEKDNAWDCVAGSIIDFIDSRDEKILAAIQKDQQDTGKLNGSKSAQISSKCLVRPISKQVCLEMLQTDGVEEMLMRRIKMMSGGSSASSLNKFDHSFWKNLMHVSFVLSKREAADDQLDRMLNDSALIELLKKSDSDLELKSCSLKFLSLIAERKRRISEKQAEMQHSSYGDELSKEQQPQMKRVMTANGEYITQPILESKKSSNSSNNSSNANTAESRAILEKQKRAKEAQSRMLAEIQQKQEVFESRNREALQRESSRSHASENILQCQVCLQQSGEYIILPCFLSIDNLSKKATTESSSEIAPPASVSTSSPQSTTSRSRFVLNGCPHSFHGSCFEAHHTRTINSVPKHVLNQNSIGQREHFCCQCRAVSNTQLIYIAPIFNSIAYSDVNVGNQEENVEEQKESQQNSNNRELVYFTDISDLIPFMMAEAGTFHKERLLNHNIKDIKANDSEQMFDLHYQVMKFLMAWNRPDLDTTAMQILANAYETHLELVFAAVTSTAAVGSTMNSTSASANQTSNPLVEFIAKNLTFTRAIYQNIALITPVLVNYVMNNAGSSENKSRKYVDKVFFDAEDAMTALLIKFTDFVSLIRMKVNSSVKEFKFDTIWSQFVSSAIIVFNVDQYTLRTVIKSFAYIYLRQYCFYHMSKYLLDEEGMNATGLINVFLYAYLNRDLKTFFAYLMYKEKCVQQSNKVNARILNEDEDIQADAAILLLPYLRMVSATMLTIFEDVADESNLSLRIEKVFSLDEDAEAELLFKDVLRFKQQVLRDQDEGKQDRLIESLESAFGNGGENLGQEIIMLKVEDFFPFLNGKLSKYSLIDLEANFLAFHQKFYKPCSLCKRFAPDSQLIVCLMCGDVICAISCSKNPVSSTGNCNLHAMSFHDGKCVMMALMSAQIVYIDAPKTVLQNLSIFENMHGQTIQPSFYENWRDFIPNKKRVEAIRNVVLMRKLPQHIRTLIWSEERGIDYSDSMI